jgi:hypothetical protein
MGTFYELCESRLCEGIGKEISKEWRDEERKRIYDAGWWEAGEGANFLGEERKLNFLNFHDKEQMCNVFRFWIVINQEQKLIETFGSHKILTLELLLCQKHKEKV